MTRDHVKLEGLGVSCEVTAGRTWPVLICWTALVGLRILRIPATVAISGFGATTLIHHFMT